jgi:hypothetical protein
VAELLDGVGDIDWSTLSHAYGSAERVPAWLAAMTDPATCALALDDLDVAVYHQGGAVCSAGAAVVPFLIRFVVDPRVPGRPDILELLSRFAALQHEMGEPFKSHLSAQACRVALVTAFDGLVGLLDDPDPAVRRAAVEVLVELRERADQLADVLMRRFFGEADPEVAADYVLALGTVGSVDAFTAAQRAAVVAWLAGHTPPPGDSRRLTFLIAARRIERVAVPAEEMLASYADALPARAVGWLGREIGGDCAARIALARVGIGQALRTGQPLPMAEVGTVMRMWRSAPAALVDDIAAALDGPPAVREAAVHLLAVTGEAGRPWSDAVAARVGQPGRMGALAAWALARWGDRRAVAVVVRSLRREPQIFEIGSTHYADDFYWLRQDPAIADVCLPLAGYADDLVPAIRWRLRTDSATPTAYQLTELLTAFGTAAQAALPELVAMLDTEHCGLACAVLAIFGPAGARVRRKLTRLAGSQRSGASTAAWALYRMTDDPEPFLTSQEPPSTQRLTAKTARQLGDLGPLAIRHAPHIQQQLTQQPESWPSWDGVELGFAHYRITGDPTLCLDVFRAALDPLRHSRQLPVSRQALRYLPQLGPAAATLAPLLQQAVDQDERLLYSGGWRGIVEDEQARTLANQALTAIEI